MIYRYRYKSNRSAVINKVPGTNSTKRRHGCFYYFDEYIISLAFIIFSVVNTCWPFVLFCYFFPLDFLMHEINAG